jgi:hypothetical protein
MEACIACRAGLGRYSVVSNRLSTTFASLAASLRALEYELSTP